MYGRLNKANLETISTFETYLENGQLPHPQVKMFGMKKCEERLKELVDVIDQAYEGHNMLM